MKKVFLFFMVLSLGISVYAQDETVIEVQNRKGPYVTNGFWDNWFISAGGGAQVYFGKSDLHGNLGDRIAPALDISLGKWITPSAGVRLQYSGLQAKGWTKGLLPYSDGNPDKDGFYKEKFNTMNLHADFMWNLSNALGGERSDRFWSFVPYVGMGLARSSGNGTDKNELAVTAGLLHNLRLSDALDLNIEMKSMFVEQRFAYTQGGKGLNALGTITAGLTYKFKTRGFQRASDLIVIEDNTRYVEQIAALEQMLAKAEGKRAALEMEMKAQKFEFDDALNEAQNQELPAPVLPNLAIFFEIGKADISEKAMINIGYIADVLKQYPDKKFVLYASADKETGTPDFNMELSKKRGEAVCKAMVEKFGLDPQMLRIEAVGSTVQKFKGAQLNRVVVIEDMEE